MDDVKEGDDVDSKSDTVMNNTEHHVTHQHEILQQNFSELSTNINLTWIQYMRFSRRAEVRFYSFAMNDNYIFKGN